MENETKTPIKLSLVAAVLTMLAGAAMPASAQPFPDTEYCAALSAKYQRYVGSTDAQHRGLIRNATNDHAIAQCQPQAAEAIPVLEQALTNAKVALPPRS